MYEYEILDKTTGETTFVWGYNWKDAMRRSKLEEKNAQGQIVRLYCEYVD